jgi:hypothetical protein
MISQPHPEKLDFSPSRLTKFRFDLAAAADATKDNNKFLQEYKERIKNLGRETSIDGFNILEAILGISQDKEALKRLSQALVRAAELQEVVDVLERRQQCLTLADEDPEWFALAFGDHLESVEQALLELGIDKEE